MKNRYYFLLFLLAGLFSCVPPDTTKVVEVNVDISDPVTQRLFEFQDKRLTDSLLRYITHENPTYRFLAARAFGSVQDSTILEKLGRLLRDESEDVRIAAAFAIGQIGSMKGERVLLAGFDKNDSLLAHQESNATILESIGKCGGTESLKNIASISTYKVTDTILLEGQALAIYRFGTRQIASPEGTSKMVGFVINEKIPDAARLIAANYLRRTKSVQLDTLQTRLLCTRFQQEKSPEIRMCIANSVCKTAFPVVFNTVIPAINSDEDYRVKVELIRGLKNFPQDTARTIVAKAVKDKNEHVSTTAAQYFIDNGRQIDADWYWRITKEAELNWQTQLLLFQASNKHLGNSRPESRDYINYVIKSQFDRSNDPYEKAACLAALGEFGWNYRTIHDRGFTDQNPVLRTTAVSALATIADRPDFYPFFGEGSGTARREINYYLHEAIQSGDAGMIAVAAETLLNSKLDFKKMADSAQLVGLTRALTKLRIPQEIETYSALVKTVEAFTGQPQTQKTVNWNHPIDWPTLTNLGQNPSAIITTSIGEITIALIPTAAPGSVANFVKLANQGFFNTKTFHRVVPNFVVQGGCPRGDGYGSLDYSVRSELSTLRYDSEGWVGMASSGKDTEGTQFFITHSSTPHLDGKYTIFGKVTAGMDIVQRIQIGDQILKVKINGK